MLGHEGIRTDPGEKIAQIKARRISYHFREEFHAEYYRIFFPSPYSSLSGIQRERDSHISKYTHTHTHTITQKSKYLIGNPIMSLTFKILRGLLDAPGLWKMTSGITSF